MSVSGGYGYGYGEFGVQARHDFALLPWVHLGPLVAIGVATTADLVLVGSAGLSAGLGYQHRLAVDLLVAPTVFESLNLHGTVVDMRPVYGPVVGAGYEYVSETGVFQRLAVGYGWSLWNSSQHSAPASWTVTIGIGARVW